MAMEEISFRTYNAVLDLYRKLQWELPDTFDKAVFQIANRAVSFQ